MNVYILFSATIGAFAALVATANPAKAEGFQVDVHGGWDNLSNGGIDSSGVNYGLGAGYDFNLSENVFAGLAVSADFSTTKKCANNILAVGDRACIDASRDLSAVARLGYNITPKDRIYALAGYSNARFKLDYTTPTGVFTRDAANLDGVRVGAGYERSLSEHTFAKVEYRYSNYEAGTSRHQALAGVGYTFR